MERGLFGAISLLALLLQIAARGHIEFEISTTDPVSVRVTACPIMACFDHNIQAAERIVLPDAPSNFREGDYTTRPSKTLDVWIQVRNITTHEAIGEGSFNPPMTTNWTIGNINTDNGVQLEVKFRNVCDRDYYGKECEKRCTPNYKLHWECSENGDRVCHEGWGGINCNQPICDCSEYGKCTSPNVCSCRPGYRGLRCQTCIPQDGCVNGDCAYNQPYTCACYLGFTGELCKTDLNICKKEPKCQHNGTCKLSALTSTGFKCECLPGYYGERCEKQTEVNLCGKGFICLHGGICKSTDRTYCLCPERYSGTHCEYEKHDDCTTKMCLPGTTCVMVGVHPVCAATPPTNSKKTKNSSLLALVFFFFLLCLILHFIRKLFKRIHRSNFYDLASARYTPDDPPAQYIPLVHTDYFSTISQFSSPFQDTPALLDPPPYSSLMPDFPSTNLLENPSSSHAAHDADAEQVDVKETNKITGNNGNTTGRTLE